MNENKPPISSIVRTAIAILVGVSSSVTAYLIDVSGDIVLKVLIPSFITSYIIFIITNTIIADGKLDGITRQVKNNRNEDLEETEKVIKILSGATDDLRDSVSHISFVGAAAEKFSRLNGKKNVIKSVGQEALSTFLESYEIDETEERLSFSGQKTALSAYAELWRILLSEQEKRRAENKDQAEPIHAYVTHSNAIDIWMNDEDTWNDPIVLVNSYQEDFIKLGGTVHRILVNTNRFEDDSEKESLVNRYHSVAKEMQEIGVFPAYLDTVSEKSSVRQLPSDDFIIVKLGEDFVSLRWKPSGRANYIGGCEVSMYVEDFRKNQSVWRQYLRAIERAAKEDAPDDVFQDLNRSFIAAYPDKEDLANGAVRS